MVVEKIPQVVGMIYAIAALLIILYLIRKDKLSKNLRCLFLLVTALVGFIVFAPMFPNQFQLIVLRDTGQLGAPIALAIVGLTLFIVLALLFGRIFCGYLCPIGAVQELVYHIPSKKVKIKNKKMTILFRAAFFFAFIVIAIFFSQGVLSYFGLKEFFYLDYMSPFFYVFLFLTISSIFVYRPFCRFFCPYGLLLSLASIKSMFRLRRTDACIECGKCERACPTNEASRMDLKQECYMCNRCVDACPVNAIVYTRKKGTR